MDIISRPFEDTDRVSYSHWPVDKLGVCDVEFIVESFVDSVPHCRDKSHMREELPPAHGLEDVEDGKRGAFHPHFGDVVEIDGAKNFLLEFGQRVCDIFEGVEVLIWRVDKARRVNQYEGLFNGIDFHLHPIGFADIGALTLTPACS